MTDYEAMKKNGQWAAIKDGSKKVSAYADSQKEAEKLAKEFCKNSGGGEVRIHKPKGPIRDSDTVRPGNDPCPPKDKKH